MRVSPNNHRGFVVDWAADEEVSLRAMLDHAIRRRHFDFVSIYNINLNEPMRALLDELGFRADNWMRTIEKELNGEQQMYVRSSKPDPVEDDHFLGGLDIRRIENWGIREICSDAF